jgi:hypothetical protein
LDLDVSSLSTRSFNWIILWHLYISLERYDGDVEMKTEAEIARDLLLYRQDVKPVVERMKSVCLGVGVVWIVSCIGLNVLFHYKPLFDEYDPELLERLVYDDKVAGIAAEQSNGIPTYCNSRYYRAVANGGQGCK